MRFSKSMVVFPFILVVLLLSLSVHGAHAGTIPTPPMPTQAPIQQSEPTITPSPHQCASYLLQVKGTVSGKTFPPTGSSAPVVGLLNISRAKVGLNPFNIVLVIGQPGHYGYLMYVSNTSLIVPNPDGPVDMATIQQKTDPKLGQYWDLEVTGFATFFSTSVRTGSAFSGDNGPFVVRDGQILFLFSADKSQVAIAVQLSGTSADGTRNDSYTITSGKGDIQTDTINCEVSGPDPAIA